MKGLKQKKAHLMEIQVNGGTIAQKVDYAYEWSWEHSQPAMQNPNLVRIDDTVHKISQKNFQPVL